MSAPRHSDLKRAVAGLRILAWRLVAALIGPLAIRTRGRRPAAMAAERASSPANTPAKVEPRATPTSTAAESRCATAPFTPIYAIWARSTPTASAISGILITPNYVAAKHAVGDNATVIGLSVAGRPLEVFRFGAGCSGLQSVNLTGCLIIGILSYLADARVRIHRHHGRLHHLLDLWQ